MRRREFSLGAAALASGAVWPARAQVRVPEDGREYRTLDRRVPVEAPAPKIEVVDFFWYSCGHCNAFEPQLQSWERRLPDDVAMRRIPVAFRDSMVPQQRMFHSLEAMGQAGALHLKIFDAIHKERVNLNSLAGMVEWLGRQGVDTARFTELYNSFAISAKARRSTDIQNLYQVEGTPAFGIAGRWYTDPTLTQNTTRMLQVADFLVGRARQGA